MKRVLSAILTLFVIVALATPAFAAIPDESVVSPLYTYIRQTATDLQIDENTGISVSTASCYSVKGYTVEIVCRLQQYTGSTWSTLKTWTASGSRYASINENWAVLSGYTYRVFVSYRILNSAGSIVESTSSTKTYVYPKQ